MAFMTIPFYGHFVPSTQRKGMVIIMEDAYLVSRFDEAIMLLPQSIRRQARELRRDQRALAEEIRLRTGRAPTVLLPDGEYAIGKEPVTKRELEMTLELSTGASVHSSIEQMRAGYITSKGGFRLGLCGNATVSDGAVTGFSSISSVALRISREIKGAARDVINRIYRNGFFESTLIISPPGGGKTTLLRDIVRLVSDGGVRTALADERGEIAAMTGGVPQMDVGERTDVLDSCPKAKAVMMLLRTMNPELIALDEITAPEDIEAIGRARNCGVSLLATAHAYDPDDLKNRPLYRGMLEDRIFKNIIIIRKHGKKREYAFE